MNPNHEANPDRLGEFVVRVMKETGVPGAAVGILHRGQAVTAGFGVTHVDHPLPVTDETLFQIGSITKTFTGTAIMRLVEMDKLDLDAPVRTYVPDFKVSDETAASRATIRHLLTHMGGWEGDVFENTGAGEDALARFVASMAGLEQLVPLGTVWSYSNAGFSLAGYLIEVVTGKSYQAALKELVLEPLGLGSSYFNPGDVMLHRFAVGHNVTQEGAQVARPWPVPRAIHPAGGITCHVQDLLRYARFHLGDGSTIHETRLLSPASMAHMHSPQVTVWGSEAWGLAWAVDEIDGTRRLWHDGGTVGQASSLVLIPEHNFAIAIFTNANLGGFLTRAVSRWALKEYLGLDTPQPTPVESPSDTLAAYVGRYVRPYADIELSIRGGKLMAQMTPKLGFPTRDAPPLPTPPPMSLGLCEPDRLLVLDGPYKDTRLDIIRKPDGSIGWLRASGRVHVFEV